MTNTIDLKVIESFQGIKITSGADITNIGSGIGDINGDGYNDVILSGCESIGAC